jgi:hypothetical protein
MAEATGRTKDKEAEGTNQSAPSVGGIIKVADIDWRVLDVQGNKALLISEKILEMRPYIVDCTATTWEQCTLREYLNNEFYNKLGAAKSAVAETHNYNPDNPWYGTSGGNTTQDKVFLLSLDEVCRYFGDSTANLRRKGSTGSDYFIGDGNNAAREARDGSGTACWWWLRSPGGFSGGAALVDDDGGVHVGGYIVDISVGGVRPAFWLNLESGIF